MQSPILRVAKAAPKLFKRNIGICAPVLQKASDPIQQLFVDKLREYRSKSSGGKLVEPSPEMEKELQANLEKVFKQYGGKPGEDLTKFPTINFPEAKIDPIDIEQQQ